LGFLLIAATNDQKLKSSTTREALNTKEWFSQQIIYSLIYLEAVYLLIWIGWYFLIPDPIKKLSLSNELELTSVNWIGFAIIYISHLPVIVFICMVVLPEFTDSLRNVGGSTFARAMVIVCCPFLTFPIAGTITAWTLLLFILLYPRQWPEDNSSFRDWLVRIFLYPFSSEKRAECAL
jgi:hypothetical protein